MKIYFLAYRDSVEEQLFVSAVRKEKDSFSKIIRERAVRASAGMDQMNI